MKVMAILAVVSLVVMALTFQAVRRAESSERRKARRAEARAARDDDTREIDADSERLRRVETAIDTIAVEVERLGESQRFLTKLLAERAKAEAPGQRQGS